MATKRPATARAGRDAFAAGAARASGERRRRTRTPLLPTAGEETEGAGSQEVDVVGDRLVVEVPAGQPAETPVSEAPVTEAPITETPAAETPAAETPAAEAPGRTATGGDAIPTEGEAEPPDATRPGGSGKHRPSPVPGVHAPTARVITRSGRRPERVPRPAAPPTRAADAARAATRAAKRATGRSRPLRAVPDLEAPPEASAEVTTAPAAGADLPPMRPVPEPGTIRPGIEDLLQAGVAALRTVVSATGVAPDEVERQVAGTLAFLRRRLTGDFTVDDYGFDADFTESVVLPLLRPFYRSWFRVEVRGLENLPASGGGLVVANHSGTVAMDSLMTQVAVHDEHPSHRHLRMLGADLVFQTPVVGQLARKSGSTLATNPDAERLLTGGELVGVWPEGFKGVGKPFSERYKLQRFGRGGFVSAAIGAGVPIIPCSIVGAEEIAPILGNMKTVARLLGVPYVPVTPTFPWLGPLGLIPLPSKWIIEFGVPVQTSHLGPGAAEDPMLVFDLTDQIRETIQQTLYSLLMQRRSVFF